MRALVAGWVAAAAWAGVPDGYRQAATCPFGSSGSLQLLLDSRITAATLAAHWGSGEDGVTPGRGRPALLRWLAGPGEPKASLDLGCPLARLSTRSAVPGEGPRVTVDASVGMGSYNGPMTHWVVAEAGQLAWAKARNPDGTATELTVMESLRTAWKRRPRPDGSLDVLELACRPEDDPAKPGEVVFWLNFFTYHFDGQGWTRALVRRPGDWSNGEDPFPTAAFSGSR